MAKRSCHMFVTRSCDRNSTNFAIAFSLYLQITRVVRQFIIHVSFIGKIFQHVCERAPPDQGHIQTEKASTCFTRLYGRAAYEAWKAREAEIDELMRRRVCSRREIIELREANFRQMKLGKPDSMSCEKVTPIVITLSPATMAA